MATATVKNKPAHYKEWGDGQTVIVMLHGWGADSGHYEKIGPLLAGSGFRVIVPDMPGWGSTPPPETAWTVSDYRDWVNEFAQSIGLTEFVLFGHSFGGRVAIKYSIKYPYEVKSLILCAAAGIKPDPSTLRRKILKTTATLGKKAFSLPGVNKLAPAARKVLYRAAKTKDYNEAEGVMKETIVKVLEEDLSALLPQISHKTLILWGTDDGATPLADAQKISRLIKNAKLVTFEGVKHNIPKLIPDKAAEEISRFLKTANTNVIE